MDPGESTYDAYSWHDCSVWRLALRVGDPELGDWTSDLVLDLDYIVEWLCGVEGGAQFRVAPATLVFHGVTDFAMQIDWSSGARVALNEMVIDRIDREPSKESLVPSHTWTVRLAWPHGGLLRFDAPEYTLTLHAEPRVTDSQKLTREQRVITPE